MKLTPGVIAAAATILAATAIHALPVPQEPDTPTGTQGFTTVNSAHQVDSMIAARHISSIPNVVEEHLSHLVKRNPTLGNFFSSFSTKFLSKLRFWKRPPTVLKPDRYSKSQLDSVIGTPKVYSSGVPANGGPRNFDVRLGDRVTEVSTARPRISPKTKTPHNTEPFPPRSPPPQKLGQTTPQYPSGQYSGAELAKIYGTPITNRMYTVNSFGGVSGIS